MKLEVINKDFSICKIPLDFPLDLTKEFCFIGKTDEEFSLVCQTQFAPLSTIAREDGWKCFRVKGTLDFSLVGILSKISTILAEQKISVFAVSTFNTDYIFTKADVFSRALKILEEKGYEII